jgi:Flp pilus assembly protein TadD
MSTPPDADEARDLVEQSRNLHSFGHPVRALPLVLRAAHLAPDDEEVREALRATREQIRHLFAEVTQCEQTLAAHPVDGPALLALADALTHLDRNTEAETPLARALDANAGDWEALYHLGHLLNNTGRFDAALAAFERLSVLEPDLSLSWTFQGMVLSNLRRPADALPMLERALALNPKDIGVWTMKVRALRMLGREPEAREAYQHERAARIASGNPRWMPHAVYPDEAQDSDQESCP